MKIVAGADWRDTIPFDIPVSVADIAPGEPARCALCGADAAPLPRTELWAVKHRHPKNSAGYVRFYCVEHRPAPKAPPVAPPAPVRSTRARTTSVRVERAPRREAAPERPAVMCPDCFVAVPASGICGMCGQPVG